MPTKSQDTLTDPYVSAYARMKYMLGAMPPLKPHAKTATPEDSDKTLGSMAGDFGARTQAYREWLSKSDPEAGIQDMLANALHWTHAQGMDVKEILANALADFVYENNHRNGNRPRKESGRKPTHP